MSCNIELNSMSERDFVIRAEDLTYLYSDTKVLDETNVAVPKSGVYALLGPNGCGKTTLLKCIVGQLEPVAGSVTVFGKKPGDVGCTVPGPGVGYMPQEGGLFDSFTIDETLTYFGKLGGLHIGDINDKIVELTELLELPKTESVAKDLSGGERRRLSLAVTLVNDAPLLILDEPTIGIEVTLRQKLWKHLTKLTKESHVTVILTTHYISEAKEANTVAFMRSGKIICETSPQNIFQQLRVSSLETAFLKLCKMTNYQSFSSMDDTPARNNNELLPNVQVKYFVGDRRISAFAGTVVEDLIDSAHIDLKKTTSRRKSLYQLKEETQITMNQKWVRIRAHLWKNFVYAKHHPYLVVLKLLLVVSLALLYPLLFGGKPDGLKLTVLNDDKDVISTEFLKQVDGEVVDVNLVNTFEEANATLDSAGNYAIVHFQAGYSVNIFNFDRITQKDAICQPRAFLFHVYGDLSNQLIRAELEQHIKATFNRTKQSFADRNQELIYFATTEIPFAKNFTGDGIERSVKDVFVLNMFLAFIYFVGFVVTAVQLQIEMANSFLERTLVAGLTIGEVFISLTLTSMPQTLLQSLALQLFLPLLFGLELAFIHRVYIFALQVLIGISGTIFGLVLASLAKSRTTLGFLFVPFAQFLVLSGVFFSTTTFPSFFYFLSKLIPLTQSMWSIRYLLHWGWSITNPYVLTGFISPVLLDIALCVIAFYLLKQRVGKSL